MSASYHSRELESRTGEMKENEQPEMSQQDLTAAEMSSSLTYAKDTYNNSGDNEEEYAVDNDDDGEEEDEESWEWNGPNFADLNREEEEIYSDFQDDRTGGGILSLKNRELENLSASYLASSQHKRDLLMFDDHDDEDDSEEEGEFEQSSNNAKLVDENEVQREGDAAAEVGSDDEEDLMFTDDVHTMAMSGTSRKTNVQEGDDTLESSTEYDSYRTAPGGPALGDTDVWKKEVEAKELHSSDLEEGQGGSTGPQSNACEKRDGADHNASNGKGPSYMRATMATSGRMRPKYSGINSRGPAQRETMNATTKSHRTAVHSDTERNDFNKSQPVKSYTSSHYAAPTESSSAPRQGGYETVASGVHKFFSDVPARYHTDARNSKQPMTKAEKRKLTVPVSPHLHYEERAKTREHSHTHTHQNAEEISEHTKPFKARPWNKQAFSSVKLPQRAAPRPPTVPQSPNCTHHQTHSHVHHATTDEKSEEKQTTFKARPMPKYLTGADRRVRNRDSSHPLTTPESPSLSTKHRAVARPPAPPEETGSKPLTERTAKKVSRPPTIPEASQYRSGTDHVTKMKTSRPKSRHIGGTRKETETTTAAHKEKQPAEAEAHHFKARPVPKAVKEQTKAFKPMRSNKPPTRIASVCLHTDKRTQARQAFEERNKARLREMELKKQKEQEEKRRKEEEEIRRLRNEQLVFKARPVRINQQQRAPPQRQEERKNSLTVPETPPLHTKEKSRHTSHVDQENEQENESQSHQVNKARTGRGAARIQTRRMTKGSQPTATAETGADVEL